MRKIIGLFLILGILFAACGDDDSLIPEEPFDFSSPDHFPEMEYPEDNPFSIKKFELGKALFYDTRLSRDNSISCGSCHQPAFGFGDQVPLSVGVENREGFRNAPSLINIGYHPYFLREGGVASLEAQILVPIQEHVEFDFNILLIEELLAQDSSYQRMSQEAYNRPFDYYVLTRAIATFERALVGGNSLYDFYEQGMEIAMTEQAVQGMNLFFSEQTKCSNCHGGFNFTNYALENNGLYESYADEGLHRLTLNEEDRGKFKVPSLRNLGLTAPYMHDGSLTSLEEVIEHYNQGGKDHPNKNAFIQPLGLTETEKAALIEFLQNYLTDWDMVSNPIFQP